MHGRISQVAVQKVLDTLVGRAPHGPQMPAEFLLAGEHWLKQMHVRGVPGTGR